MTQKDTCTPVFIAALFTIAKTWKQPKYPLTDEWIKMWCIWNTTQSLKSQQITNTGEGVEKREPSYTVGENVNW